MKLKFGTDGIRGPVESVITPLACISIGTAAGAIFKSRGITTAVIGRDTRASCDPLELALCSGLISSGVDVLLLGVIPTPAVAYHTRQVEGRFGIMISASHNNYLDNGIKFFSSSGGKISNEIEREIESVIELDRYSINLQTVGSISHHENSRREYIDYCISVTSINDRKLNGLKIVLDCANGACYSVAPSIFSILGADVIVSAAGPDGVNINEKCGSTDLRSLRKLVPEHQADVGIAFDGDGDRVMMIDSTGSVVDGDDILYIISHTIHSSNTGIVGTTMTNTGLEHDLVSRGFEFIRTDVGDKYVNEQLESRGWHLGGETSGHIICKDVSTTGDGIIAALKVVSFLHESKIDIKNILKGYNKTSQILHSVPVSDKSVITSQVFKQKIIDIERDLKVGRVLVRASGTENVVRILVEHPDEDVAKLNVKVLVDFFENLPGEA